MSHKYQNVNDLSTVEFSENNDEDLTFFSYIDEATKEWLKSLEQIWQIWKKGDVVNKTLIEYFDSAPNPYLSTIRILVNTSDFKHIKKNSSLAFTVIEEYAEWIKSRKEMYEQFLVLDLKLATFQLIIKQNNMEFIKMVASTYKFVEHKEEFLHIIQEMIQEKKYKEAAQYAVILKLQESFSDPESLILPLILQNKLTVVEEFLIDCPRLQEALVLYLDNLIRPDNSMHNLLNELIIKNKIPDVKMSITNTKPMGKLIARFVKLYNLPSELCINLNKKRCEGVLQYLIHKRYKEYSLSTDSWREMVQDAVKDDETLQLTMIKMLLNTKDSSEALYWAKKFNVAREKWPWILLYEEEQNESESINEGASTSKINDWEDDNDLMNYYELKLSRDSIKIINNPYSFEEFLDKGLDGVSIVGIDSEWKPCFGTKQTELALIQIATKDNVYIIDVTTMGNKFTELWAKLALVLFENKNILKLGFGIAQDMTVIRSSLPALSKIKIYGQGYLDIVNLWKKLVEDYKFVFPHESDDQFTKKNLSKLVELCLGQKLNKSDQFSNWEQRPLRESQIIYAALDAYCLLEIYATLEIQCEHLEIPFDDACLELQHIPFKSSSQKNIRRLAQKSHGGERCVKLAMREKRVFLTRNKGYLKFLQYIPSEDCYFVLSDTPDEQLREVLNHFKIAVTHNDIFSRCQACNSNEFSKVRKSLMYELSKSYAELTGKNNYNISPNPSYHDDTYSYLTADAESNDLEHNTNLKHSNDDRPWILNIICSVNVSTCSTKYQARIQIDQVPMKVLQNVQFFYICDRCGKIYWNGTHLERTLKNSIKDILMPTTLILRK
ncbi:exonuclease mut-7 isoform X1 [Apis mellifera carnica]|nr:exonuclease mut-7 isoform X1 [Apis mellifera carnica]